MRLMLIIPEVEIPSLIEQQNLKMQEIEQQRIRLNQFETKLATIEGLLILRSYQSMICRQGARSNTAYPLLSIG